MVAARPGVDPAVEGGEQRRRDEVARVIEVIEAHRRRIGVGRCASKSDARGQPGRATISPRSGRTSHRARPPSRARPSAIVASSSRSARPGPSAWSANAEPVTRSAQSDPHHARSSGLAKHQTLADAVTSVKPAACAQARSRRPAAGLAPVRPGDLPVQLHPSVERRRVGVPDDRGEVHVPRGHHAARPSSRGASPRGRRPDRPGAAGPGGRGRHRNGRHRRRARRRRRSRRSTLVRPASAASAVAARSTSGSASMPITRPGATAARSPA